MTQTPDQLELPIAETFTSIQGEGKLTGMPSHFIRVSGCNLRCGWCDTPYASWNPETPRQSLGALVAGAKASGTRHVVLTGGEPMMFAQIEPLSRALREHGFHITIETAGTIDRPVACDLLSLSPKLANSTPHNDPRDPKGEWAARHEQRRLNIPVLQSLLDTHRDRQLKFVVSGAGDLPEIETLVASLQGVAPSDILLMPEGVTSPSPEKIAWVVDTCIARGWRLCRRVHLDLFGNKRGT
ncbi:MAG: 7-carboxy-7-deazaguanine synthase QueE [Planctomycetota bacterium]